jgi:hypothetical protein
MPFVGSGHSSAAHDLYSYYFLRQAYQQLYTGQSALPSVRPEEALETFYHLVDRALSPACSSRLSESRDYGGAVLVTAELPDLSASKGERMDPVGLDCLARALDTQGVVP